MCDLLIPYGNDSIVVRLETPGLWSIEVDNDLASSLDTVSRRFTAYVEEVFSEEKSIMLGMLAELGATPEYE